MPLKKRAGRKKKALKKRVVKKRVVKKRPLKKRAKAARPRVVKKAKEEIIGIVTHYFPKVRAAVTKLKAPLSVGETVKIKGHTTDFKQTIASMQINHVPINQGKKGDEIGFIVDSRVRQHDVICRVR